MKFADKTITLKDGRMCTLKPTTAEYAQEMIDFLMITASETPFLLRYPDEITYTVEGEQEILNSIYENEKSVMMLALVDGKVAGNCSFSGVGAKRRVFHRCLMAIALKKEFWGLGIGTAMINYLTELAKKAGYERMELDYIEGNERAKKLYDKCGFVETGRRIKAMKYDDGTYRDEFIMSKEL